MKLPPLSETDIKWFHLIHCVDGPVIVSATGRLEEEEGKYVFEIRTTDYTRATRKRAREIEDTIVRLLCENGGKRYWG